MSALLTDRSARKSDAPQFRVDHLAVAHSLSIRRFDKLRYSLTYIKTDDAPFAGFFADPEASDGKSDSQAMPRGPAMARRAVSGPARLEARPLQRARAAAHHPVHDDAPTRAPQSTGPHCDQARHGSGGDPVGR
jgi:hypothetical protein